MSPARKVTVYDPTADPKSTGVTLAPRLDTFKGKRAGILDNGKPNAGFLMLTVARRLQEQYGVGEIVKREKGIAGAPSPTILDALTQCDFALVGSAD